jgi:hypothetical protein
MVEAVRAEMQAEITEANAAKEEAFQLIERRVHDLDSDVAAKVASAKTEIERKARTDAKAAMEADFAAEQDHAVRAQQEAEELRAKLTVAQAAQAEALKKERLLADRERELELTVQRGIGDGIELARCQAQQAAEDAQRLKLLERDTVIEGLQKKIAELAQRAEQGSQQLQGEVQELDIEQALRAKFPQDTVTEVGKGVNGADVVHHVFAPDGSECGLILIESKRTKTFSAPWLAKLRQDGRASHADILVLVTTALPKEISTFDEVDGVWVTSPEYALPLMAILREALLRVHAAKLVQEGVATKSEVCYAYLTGPRFKQRVEAVVEAFKTLGDELDKERRSMTKQWAKRAELHERALLGTAGLVGDLQGMSAALPAVAGLELE